MTFTYIPEPIYTAAIAAFGGIMVVLVNSLLARRKNNAIVEKTEAETEEATAETARIVTATALSLVRVSQDQIGNLESRIDVLEQRDQDKSRRIASLEHDARVYRDALASVEEKYKQLQTKLNEWNEGIQILIDQIGRHGITPDWRPEG